MILLIEDLLNKLVNTSMLADHNITSFKSACSLSAIAVSLYTQSQQSVAA